MPKKLHNALRRAAKKRGLTGESYNAYVYGTMAKRKKGKKRGKR